MKCNSYFCVQLIHLMSLCTIHTGQQQENQSLSYQEWLPSHDKMLVIIRARFRPFPAAGGKYLPIFFPRRAPIPVPGLMTQLEVRNGDVSPSQILFCLLFQFFSKTQHYRSLDSPSFLFSRQCTTLSFHLCYCHQRGENWSSASIINGPRISSDRLLRLGTQHFGHKQNNIQNCFCVCVLMFFGHHPHHVKAPLTFKSIPFWNN